MQLFHGAAGFSGAIAAKRRRMPIELVIIGIMTKHSNITSGVQR
jgi:hypothetical protein